IRVDTGVAPGDVIPPQFDSMIAKVIAWGQDRAEARARLSRALRQTSTVIRGGTTSKAFLLDLLSRPEFVRGEVDTNWLDTIMADGYAPPLRVDVALLATAFEAYEAHERRQRDRLFTSAERGRPEVGHETRHQVDVRMGGEAYRLRMSRSRPVRYQVELDGRAVDVDVERSGRFELRLTVGGQAFDVLSVAQGPDYLVEVDGAVHRISGGEAGLVRAPAPAMVVAITVAAGDEVAEGDVVAVVESMKLETSLRSPATGRVAEVFADVNTQVESGAKLLRIEPEADEAEAAETADGRERADLGALSTAAADGDPAGVAADALAALRSLVLGFDVDETEAGRQLRRLAAARDALPADDPRLLAGEAEILRIFADVSALWRSRRVRGESQADDEAAVDAEAARNPQEYMHAYLRSRNADAEGLPESFRIRLRRTLAHYGVDSIEPSPDLEPAPELEAAPELDKALYRIFLAHRRAAGYVPVVSELLQWRLRQPQSLGSGVLGDEARDGYRRVINQLLSATQLRHPGVGDLARQVRYRCFDEPLIAAERARAQQQVRAELDHLAADPAARTAQIDAIVASGEPILGVFTERHHAVMLEVMTRRYYWIRALRNVQLIERSGRPLLTAEYAHDGQDYLIIATVADGSESAAGTGLPELITALPPGRIVLIDLYVTSQTPEEEGSGEPEARAERIRGKLGLLPPSVARVAVAVRRPDGEGGGWPDWFTFVAGPDGAAVEDRTQRGWHPLVA
ncbi:MAG TPA: biotin/lipoyl-containing protein, partial [Nakamurella sp.]